MSTAVFAGCVYFAQILNVGTPLLLLDCPIFHPGKCFRIYVDQQWSKIIDYEFIIGQKNGEIMDHESWRKVPSLTCISMGKVLHQRNSLR